MKICLATRFFDFRNAGLGRFSIELRKKLIERGHEVVSVSCEKDGLVPYFAYTFWGIRGRLPKDFDVYHALTPMEAMWLPKQRAVVTFHDLIPMTHSERAPSHVSKNALTLFIGTWCFSYACFRAAKCYQIACDSELTRREVSELLKVPWQYSRVIRPGIREDLESTGKRNGMYRIGYLGQLDRRKRVDLLIGAFKESKVDAELVIGGMGRDDAQLKSMAGGDGRIKFLGFVPDDELCGFLNSLDVFISPTWIEGYGLPLVEGMACKKPIVVLDDAVIPQDIKSRCFVVDNLREFFNSTTVELPKKVMDAVEGNYVWAKAHTWERCADEYEQLYKEVIDA